MLLSRLPLLRSITAIAGSSLFVIVFYIMLWPLCCWISLATQSRWTLQYSHIDLPVSKRLLAVSQDVGKSWSSCSWLSKASWQPVPMAPGKLTDSDRKIKIREKKKNVQFPGVSDSFKCISTYKVFFFSFWKAWNFFYCKKTKGKALPPLFLPLSFPFSFCVGKNSYSAMSSAVFLISLLVACCCMRFPCSWDPRTPNHTSACLTPVNQISSG